MKKNAGKAPSIQFYYKDWLSDQRLKRASKIAKGVWIDLICISCDMEKPGVFCDENGPISEQEILDMLNGNRKENTKEIDVEVILKLPEKRTSARARNVYQRYSYKPPRLRCQSQANYWKRHERHCHRLPYASRP